VWGYVAYLPLMVLALVAVVVRVRTFQVRLRVNNKAGHGLWSRTMRVSTLVAAAEPTVTELSLGSAAVVTVVVLVALQWWLNRRELRMLTAAVACNSAAPTAGTAVGSSGDVACGSESFPDSAAVRLLPAQQQPPRPHCSEHFPVDILPPPRQLTALVSIVMALSRVFFVIVRPTWVFVAVQSRQPLLPLKLTIVVLASACGAAVVVRFFVGIRRRVRGRQRVLYDVWVSSNRAAKTALSFLAIVQPDVLHVLASRALDVSALSMPLPYKHAPKPPRGRTSSALPLLIYGGWGWVRVGDCFVSMLYSACQLGLMVWYSRIVQQPLLQTGVRRTVPVAPLL
jgi:hypothetical protein